jgi:DNA recombination protein RmuC
MELVSLILAGLSLLLVIIIYFTLVKSKAGTGEKFSKVLKAELKENREELSKGLKENREELNNSITKFQQSFLESLQKINEILTITAKSGREEMSKSLQLFQENFTQNVKTFNDLQKQKFEDMSRKQDELIKSTELKLEKMRETVDEKLHKTLEERLGQSFKIVSEQLQAVQKGLGEMQNLASGVGDLKKVLTNVKTRGILGEIQLGNILEQIMAPEQYDVNVKTKAGSNDHVEYAIKLPGKDEAGKVVYLPIDAKFPQEDYQRLQVAYEKGDIESIEASTRSLSASIRKFAKDIHAKYIDPPHTTDFGIMFLPVEGLYAEVVRQPDMVTSLQRDYKIIVTGPTTLAAMLNSLQMGFRTLAIQKRSSEVWEILGAVKTEFGKFGGVLEKAQKKISEANDELDKLVTTRTNVINRKLRQVQEMPAKLSANVLDASTEMEDEPEIEAADSADIVNEMDDK